MTLMTLSVVFEGQVLQIGLFIRPDSALNHYAVIFKESVIVSGI
jgi:hypothetical protein